MAVTVPNLRPTSRKPPKFFGFDTRMRPTHLCNSHVGKRLLKYPPTVTLSLNPYAPTTQFPRATGEIRVVGPLGVLSQPVDQFINLSFPKQLEGSPKMVATLSVADPADKAQNMMWGTMNSLVSNMIEGVSEGFTIPIRLNGVGYRAQLEADGQLSMKLGFSHPVNLVVPDGVEVRIPAPQRIIVQGIDLQRVTQFAANIRKWRKPEPYNQKGIFVGDETIKKKEGKKR